MSGDVDKVASFLKNHSLHASRLWLEGCVEYYKSQQIGQQVSIFDLQNFALDQWLLVDLRSMGVGCLPPDLSNRKEITLSGRYAVQVESVRDISTPAYSQLLLSRGVSTENCEATKKPPENWEPKPGRVLKLIIFDGLQEVVAMEYSLIPELNKNLIPGTKMLIIGPVKCRRGIFLLEQRNIKILGGEVDILITVNAIDNVLARALNLPENSDPYGTQESAPETVDVNQPTPRAVPTQLPQPLRELDRPNPRINQPYPTTFSDFPDDDELNNLQLADVQPVHQGSPVKDSQGIEEDLLDDEDDDLLLQLPVDELASQAMSDASQKGPQEEYESIAIPKPSTSSNVPPKWLSSGQPNKYGAGNRNERTKVTVGLISSLSQKNISSLSGQEKITSFLQGPSAVGTSSKTMEQKDEILVKWPSHLSPQEVQSSPFVYLIHLISSPLTSGVYPIKGFLVTLLSSLEDKEGHWHLLAKLSDGSANVNITFSEEVLDEIIGFSATEMRAMRQRMSGNPAIKERLKRGFQLAKKQLYELNCIFYVQFSPENEIPTIVNIENISPKHIVSMKARSFE